MNDLIHRAERAEASAWRDVISAPDAQARRRLGLVAEAIGEATLISSSGVDHLLFNRIMGLSASDADGIRRAVRHFSERGIDRYFIHLPHGPSDAPAAELLRSYGLERYRRAWHELVRDDAPPPALETDLNVRRARSDDAAACGAIWADAFDAPPTAADVFASLIDRPGWRVLVACDGDVPVAAGALFVDGDLGYLPFAATKPDFRRRGAQGALMSLRIREALARGCRSLATSTGKPAPREPNPSHDNMLRCGFRVARVRDNYAPIGTTWVRQPAAAAR